MKYLEAHDDADRGQLISGVADGLQYLHSKGVVHGDLKGANILVASDAHPVLADFGLSANEAQKTQGQTTTHAFAGTVRWMAPERLDPEQYGLNGRTSRTFASDVYSFGMTIFEIYANRSPFSELGETQALIAAVSGKRPAHPGEDAVRRGLTPAIWTFVTRCWDHQPSARPSLADLNTYRDASSDVHQLAQTLSVTNISPTNGITPPPAYTSLPSPPRQHAFEVYKSCPFCDPDNPYGYVCEHPVPDLEDAEESERSEYIKDCIPKGHSECVECDRLVPIRKAMEHDRCIVCTAIFCENVYGSCEGSRHTIERFNRGPPQPLQDWFSDEPAAEMLDLLTPYLFFGNRYEQQKLRGYVLEKGYSFSELLKSVAEMHRNDGLPRAKWQGPALDGDRANFQLSDWTCRHCALDLLEGNIFDWYLHQRETDEVLRMLSPTVRPDCPKGSSCPDAVIDFHHASRLNHICLPTISQPLQAPSEEKGEGQRVIMKGSDPVQTFRASFLPDQVTFRNRDGQPCFMVTVYHVNEESTPGQATLWDWEWFNNVHNRIKPHFQVYYPWNSREYVTKGRFGLLNEKEDMEWVRCDDKGIPEGRTPVVGGKTKEGALLHHAAVWWQTRRLPGKMDPAMGRASITYNTREIKVCEGYDVLCWK